MGSESGQTAARRADSVSLVVSGRIFHGWYVVAAIFTMALLSFGLGFYGVSVYVATLQRLHGWSAATVSAPVTVYYVAGALLTMAIGRVYERRGPRLVVAAGTVAMAAGVAGLGAVSAPWQLYPAVLVMSLGWGAMSGAAINIVVAPWWERRRGLAISLAFNGATLGGVLVAPALSVLIGRLGFAHALMVAAIVQVVVMLALSLTIMRRGPAELGLGPDGDAPTAWREPGPSTAAPAIGARGEALRTWRFWSVSIPFALGLTAQVGVLTHLVALVAPTLGPDGGARAVSVATAAALVGRVATGFVVDRLDRRTVTAVTLAAQIAGVLLLASARSVAAVHAGSILFGLGVGNLTTLPGLILAGEWPRERFSALVGLVVGINQITFAFGPSLVGIVRDATGSYAPALAVCAALQALAAVLVMLGPRSPATVRA